MIEKERFGAPEEAGRIWDYTLKRPHLCHPTFWLSHTLSVALTELYIYRAVDGRGALFSWCSSDLRKRKTWKNKGFYWSTTCPPSEGEGWCGCRTTQVQSADDLKNILQTEFISKDFRVQVGEVDVPFLKHLQCGNILWFSPKQIVVHQEGWTDQQSMVRTNFKSILK